MNRNWKILSSELVIILLIFLGVFISVVVVEYEGGAAKEISEKLEKKTQ